MSTRREKAIRFLQISGAENRKIVVNRMAPVEEDDIAPILRAWENDPSFEMTGQELQEYEDEVNAKATFVYPVPARELIKRFIKYEKKLEVESCWLCKLAKAPETTGWAYWLYHKGVNTDKRKSDDLLILGEHRAIPTVTEMVQFAALARILWPPDALLVSDSSCSHFYIRAQNIYCGKAR